MGSVSCFFEEIDSGWRRRLALRRRLAWTAKRLQTRGRMFAEDEYCDRVVDASFVDTNRQTPRLASNLKIHVSKCAVFRLRST